MAYLLLFLSAFGAATLLPLQSEAVLVGLLVQAQYSVYLLLIVATIGNVLGSCVNWYLGLKIEQFKDKKWFPVSEKNMLKAEKNISKIWFLVLTIQLDPCDW
jgi:membrane protein YqaA with SNARE-associated domain